MLGRGVSRVLSHSLDTYTSNISNTSLNSNHSTVPTRRVLWTGFFFRMRTITRIMLYWCTVSHTAHDLDSLKFEDFGEGGELYLKQLPERFLSNSIILEWLSVMALFLILLMMAIDNFIHPSILLYLISLIERGPERYLLIYRVGGEFKCRHGYSFAPAFTTFCRYFQLDFFGRCLPFSLNR